MTLCRNGRSRPLADAQQGSVSASGTLAQKLLPVLRGQSACDSVMCGEVIVLPPR